jgi:hypothetical protein
MDLELIKKIFTDKETSKKWDEFYYDEKHKDFFVNSKEDYHGAFINYSNKIVEDLKIKEDKEKAKWLSNFINLYLYDFALENPDEIHVFDLFYEMGNLNIKDEDFSDFQESLENINFENLMTKKILNQEIELNELTMLKYLSLFIRNDFPITDFIYSNNTYEIVEYVESLKTIVFSKSFLQIMNEKPILGYNLLFNEIYRDKNEKLDEKLAKERMILNVLTCRDANYYYDNHLATTPSIHYCYNSKEILKLLIEENAPSRMDEYKKIFEEKRINGSLRKVENKIYDIEKIFDTIKKRLVEKKSFDTVLSKNKNLIRYYTPDGERKNTKVDSNFIEQIVKKIFTDHDVYRKFSLFNSYKEFFNEEYTYSMYLSKISSYAHSLCHEKNKLSDFDKKWLINYLEHISISFKREPLIACSQKIFDSYDKEIFINKETQDMVLDTFKKMNYKESMKALKSKLDPKKPDQYSSDEYIKIFAVLTSNSNNLDLRAIRTFFACFLNETISIANEDILKNYIAALVEKLLAGKGINSKCSFEDLEKSHGRHMPTPECSYIIIDKSNIKRRGKDATHMLRTVFHEMRHAVQNSKIKNHELEYPVLQWTKERILKSKYGQNYYKDNYDIYIPEIDARLAGNIYLKRFLKDVAPKLLTEEFEKGLSDDIKYDFQLKSITTRKELSTIDNEHQIPIDVLVASELALNPSLLNEYQVLKMEYRPDGFRKTTGEIYKEYITISDDKLKKSYDKLLKYRHLDLDEMVSDLKSIALSPVRNSKEVESIVKLFRWVLKKNYIAEIDRHYENGDIRFVKDKVLSDLDEIEIFLDNITMSAATSKKPYKHLDLMYQIFLDDKEKIINHLQSKSTELIKR